MGRATWTRKSISKIRAEVKLELDDIEAKYGIQERLAHTLRRVQEHNDDTSSFGILRCFTYVCSALIHHIRHGGLTEPSVNRLAKLAEKLLELQGIHPFHSRLSYLYGEVLNIVGQIDREEGRHWESAWQTQMMRLHQRSDAMANSLELLTIANRSLRLGQTTVAVQNFENAMQASSAGHPHFATAALGKIKALRLSGQLQWARDAVYEVEKIGLSDKYQNELRWEKASIVAQWEGDLADFADALRSFADNRKLSYQMEAYLWSKSARHSKVRHIPTRIIPLLKKHRDERKVYSTFAKACRTIETYYDVDIPFHKRVAEIKGLYKLARAQVSIDKELLLLSAVIRWLHRFGRPEMRDFVFHHYAGLSMTLSDGVSDDVLNLFADLPRKIRIGDFKAYRRDSESA